MIGQRQIAFSILLCLNLNIFSQEISVYMWSNDIQKNINESQRAAMEFSFIGEYEKTIKEWDLGEDKKSEKLTLEQKNIFQKYKPQNARVYLSERAKTEQIIIINEAHHQPQHRLFTASLLSELYKRGFRYLCIEALAVDDSFINIRKFPIINSGGYTREPCYGRLLREALEIGFKLVAYEDTKNSGFDSLGNNLREVEQANNIKTILDKDPNAKILVHCGFGHIKEGPLKSWGKAMAGRLKEYTGINPLTIDQVTMTEHSDTTFEDVYYKEIKLNYSAVFLDSSGKLFNGSEENRQYDLRIYHPRTRYIYGRPTWIFENQRKNYFIEKIDISFPYQVYAYRAEEKLSVYNPYENPVPEDIIEIKNINDKKVLSLMIGNYLLVFKEKNGEEQKRKIEIF